MGLSKRISVGDIFAVDVGHEFVKYFWYLGKDTSQLNSDVIKVFLPSYASGLTPPFDVLCRQPVDFHVHTMLSLGRKLGVWRKVGHQPLLDAGTVMFRDTNDATRKLGEERITISSNWYVWRMNEPFRRVGKLDAESAHTEIGVVLPPECVVGRIRTGEYDFVYPS